MPRQSQIRWEVYLRKRGPERTRPKGYRKRSQR